MNIIKTEHTTIKNYILKYPIPLDIINIIIKLLHKKDIISFCLVSIEFSQLDQSVWKHFIELSYDISLPNININWKFIFNHIKKLNTLLKDGTRLDNPDMLKLGLELGYSPNERNHNLIKYVIDYNKYNSLVVFINYENISTKFLSDYALMRAVEKNDFEMVKIILSNPDIKISIDTDFFKRGTDRSENKRKSIDIVHYAAISKYIDIFKYMLYDKRYSGCKKILASGEQVKTFTHLFNIPNCAYSYYIKVFTILLSLPKINQDKCLNNYLNDFIECGFHRYNHDSFCIDMILKREQFVIDMEKLVNYVYLPHIYHPADKIHYNAFMRAVMGSIIEKNNGKSTIINWNNIKNRLSKFNTEAVCDMIESFKNTEIKFKNLKINDLYGDYIKSRILRTDLLELDVGQIDDICGVIYTETVTKRNDYYFMSFFRNGFIQNHIQLVGTKLLTMNFGKLFKILLDATLFIPTREDIFEFIKNQRFYNNTNNIIIYVVNHSKCPFAIYEKNKILANI
jgi:hypothetical protein